MRSSLLLLFPGIFLKFTDFCLFLLYLLFLLFKCTEQKEIKNNEYSTWRAEDDECKLIYVRL